MIFGFSDSQIDQIHAVLKQFKEIEEVLIFGSRAMGNFKKGSDVDLAIKGDLEPNTTSHASFLLNEETLLPYQFDVVDYQTLSNPEFKRHIDDHGRHFYP